MASAARPRTTAPSACTFPTRGETVVDDVIRGETRFPNVSMDDPVIARADGSPLYNFAVAIDDLDARITHVVRGEDHLSNTPKQLLVLEALGATSPRYAHLPLLHGPDGRKLSKRHGAASVQELRDAGYLPEAVDNYIALLGAGLRRRRGALHAERARRALPARTRVAQPGGVRRAQAAPHERPSPARARPDELTRRLEQFTGRVGLAGAVAISREKIQTLADFWPLVSFVFDGPVDDPAAFEKTIGKDGAVEALDRGARRARRGRAVRRRDGRERRCAGSSSAARRKPGQVFQPIRVAIAGQTVSPGIFETLALLGRDREPGADRRALAPRPGQGRRAGAGRGLNRDPTELPMIEPRAGSFRHM